MAKKSVQKGDKMLLKKFEKQVQRAQRKTAKKQTASGIKRGFSAALGLGVAGRKRK